MSKATTGEAEVLRLRQNVQTLLRRRVLEAVEQVLEDTVTSRSSLRRAWRVPREPRNHQGGKVMSDRDRRSQGILESRSRDRTRVHAQTWEES